MLVINKVFRNPLHAILGNLDLLEKEAKSKMEVDLIKKAKNNGEILMNMMDNIVQTHKLKQGRLNNVHSSVEIRTLI